MSGREGYWRRLDTRSWRMGNWMWIQQRIWPGRGSYLVSLRLWGLPALSESHFPQIYFKKLAHFLPPQITALIHHDLPRIHHVVSIKNHAFAPQFRKTTLENHPQKKLPKEREEILRAGWRLRWRDIS